MVDRNSLEQGLRESELIGYRKIEERRLAGQPAPSYENLSPEEKLYVDGVSRSFREGQRLSDDMAEMPTGCLVGICAFTLISLAITSPIWGSIEIYQSLKDKYLKRRI